jgi:hypothetical protein
VNHRLTAVEAQALGQPSKGIVGHGEDHELHLVEDRVDQLNRTAAILLDAKPPEGI